MKDNYDTCEVYVLASEGGYSNDPGDPGGPTNWGITIYDARAYWKKDATAADVRAMPKSVAQQIYRDKYWNALNCDDLPAGLDYTVFDYGVNSGVGRAGKILHQCLGIAAVDWHVTPEVIAAVKMRDVKLLIEDINDERLRFLQGLRTWNTFGRGWSRRVASVKANSLRMVQAPQAAEAPPLPPRSPGKAVDKPENLFSHVADLWHRITAT